MVIFLRFLGEFGDEVIGDAVEQIKPFDRQAGLAAVEKAAHRSGADGAIDIGVVANDHRIAAAQFQGHMLEVRGGGLHDAAAGVGGAGEADLSNFGIDQQFFADHAAGAGDDIQHALGSAGVLDRFVDDLTSAQIGERRGAGRFDDDAVAGEQRWTELVAHQRNREIPRHDGAADAEGFAQNDAMAAGVEHHRAGAHGFRHAAVMIEGVDEAADFQNRLAHRLALFFGQQSGELFFLLQNGMAGGQENRAALGRRHGGPFLQRALGGVDGTADIIDGSFGNGVDKFSGGRIANFGRLSAFGIDLLAGD